MTSVDVLSFSAMQPANFAIRCMFDLCDIFVGVVAVLKELMHFVNAYLVCISVAGTH